MNETKNATTRVRPVRKGSMKHYFVFAAIQGGLVGFGCVTLLNPVVGLLAAAAMASWGVKSAYDMVRHDQANASIERPMKPQKDV